jgi:hypothetical protein
MITAVEKNDLKNPMCSPEIIIVAAVVSEKAVTPSTRMALVQMLFTYTKKITIDILKKQDYIFSTKNP